MPPGAAVRPSGSAVISAPLAPTTAIAAAQAELLGLVDGALDERARLGEAEVPRVRSGPPQAPTML